MDIKRAKLEQDIDSSDAPTTAHSGDHRDTATTRITSVTSGEKATAEEAKNPGQAQKVPKSWQPMAKDLSSTLQSYAHKTSIYSKDSLAKCRSLYKERKRDIRYYSITAATILFVIVLFQNLESSQVNILFWQFPAPKIIMFSIMLAIGCAYGFWYRGKSGRILG